MAMTKEERAKRDKKIAREDARIRKAMPKLWDKLQAIGDSMVNLERDDEHKPVDRKQFTRLQARLQYADKALGRIWKIIQG